MRITARLAYGLNALVDLASANGPVKGDALAAPHDIPVRFLENTLGDLRRAGLVKSRRGGHGGYWLARPPDTITVADVLHALDTANVIDTNLDHQHLAQVWETLTQAYLDAANAITLADLATPTTD